MTYILDLGSTCTCPNRYITTLRVALIHIDLRPSLCCTHFSKIYLAPPLL